MTVKIGIIGCGAITRRAYLPGFASPGTEEAMKTNPHYYFGGCENGEVIALADIDLNKAESLAEEFKIKYVYQDWKELIANKEINAVCINVPNTLHAEIAIKAAGAGKHVMVEKPMAVTIDEADTMIKAAEENGVFLMVDQTQRFWPLHEVAVDIVQSGLIGRLISVRGKMAHAGPEYWSLGSEWFGQKIIGGHGALFDIGIHKLDFIRYMTGLKITEVAAFTETLVKDIDVEDNAVVIFKFENKALGVLEASWTCNPRENTTFVYGTEGNLYIGKDSEKPIYVEFATAKVGLSRGIPVGKITNGTYVPEIPECSKYGGPWKHFVDSIIKGEKPTPSGKDGRDSLEVILAAFESSKAGKIIKLR